VTIASRVVHTPPDVRQSGHVSVIMACRRMLVQECLSRQAPHRLIVLELLVSQMLA
jgi:hypothetical protein